MILPDQTWLLWAALLIAAAIGFWFEKSHWGARLSGPVIAMLVTFSLSNLGIIPASSPVYDTIWTYLVPFAIPLLLYNANLNRIFKESGATLMAFVIGSFGTVLGAILAFYLVPLGDHAWQLVAVFSSTYIGGSVNYFSTAEAVGLRSGDLLTAGVAADNLMMVLYFLLLFTLPNIYSLRRAYREPIPDRWGRTSETVVKETKKGASIHLPSLSTAFALSLVICGTGYLIEKTLGWTGIAILIITAITVTLATLIPSLPNRLQGSGEMGMLLMQIFFAAIGASANIAAVMKVGPKLFLFAAIILSVHLVVLMIAGKLLRLSLPEIVIASNANMGGPATAAAMAASRRWHWLVIPAILCGTFGYAIATFVGVALGKLVQ